MKMNIEIDLLDHEQINRSLLLSERIHAEINLPNGEFEMTADSNGDVSADGSFGGSSQRFDIHDMLNTAHTPTLVTILVIVVVAGSCLCCCTGCGVTAWLVIKKCIMKQARTVHSTVANTAGNLLATHRSATASAPKPEGEASPWGTTAIQMQQLMNRMQPPPYPQPPQQPQAAHQQQPQAADRRQMNIGV